MTVELSRDAQRWLARAPDIANLILVVLVALAAARLFWLVWPTPTNAIAPMASSAPDRSGSSHTLDIDAIAGAHLFGKQSAADAAAAKPKVINAPETHLNLTLTGIVSDSQGDRSRALIKGPQGKQDSYRVGQAVIKGVKLYEVYANRVILDRSGHYEMLTLESVKKAQAMTGIKRTPQLNQALAQDLGDARRKILSDPSAARRFIRLQPAEQNGSLVGYRIYPGADRSLFKKAGLKSGELVTAINGKPLNDPAASLRLLGNLANASHATVTLESGGKTRTVEVNFQ
ncbi:MAG: type II secretion system protein GspC [Salinisphaera sp.]|jgi:general secretion pathway protein C|nr:type II secretion system protein GspC [Salinisphaera sp.]